MDAFGWSTQQTPPAAASCPSNTDDALLAAFLRGASATFDNAGVGDGAAYDFTSSCPDDDLRRLLICRDSVSPLPFAVDDPSKASFLENSAGSLRAPAPAAIGAASAHEEHDSFAFFPNTGGTFSGYSTTTGNISSGDSNTYCGAGGHDAEVASPPCILTKRGLPETKTTAAATSIAFGQREYEPDTEAMAQVKEMIYRAAAMRPVVEPRAPASAAADPPPPRRRRKNVWISSDPQTVAARLRREKVSERLRALRRLVPGGGKMDTASMLHEAACYLRFLKSQLAKLEAIDGRPSSSSSSSPMQRYVGRPPWNNNPESLGDGRDGVAGYVKSNNRNMQSL